MPGRTLAACVRLKRTFALAQDNDSLRHGIPVFLYPETEIYGGWGCGRSGYINPALTLMNEEESIVVFL